MPLQIYFLISNVSSKDISWWLFETSRQLKQLVDQAISVLHAYRMSKQEDGRPTTSNSRCPIEEKRETLTQTLKTTRTYRQP